MKAQPNIAVLAPYRIYPAVSGGQRCTALLYEYLAELLPVHIVSTGSNGLPAGKPLLYKLLSDSRLRYVGPRSFFRVLRFVKKKEISVLIVEHPYFGWLGRLIQLVTATKFAVHSHNIEAERFKAMKKAWWPLMKIYERWVYKAASIIFFITAEDREYAIRNYGVDAARAFIVTYGTERKLSPSSNERYGAQAVIRERHLIREEEKILLFTGVLDYPPNEEAVKFLCNSLLIELRKKSFAFKIIICGKNAPLNEITPSPEIIFTGFVQNINEYFLGADIFVNPVIEGGGIKTKLIEALGFGLPSVSFFSGAIGIPAVVSQPGLKRVADGNILSFADAICTINSEDSAGSDFYSYFYWGNIAAKAAAILEGK